MRFVGALWLFDIQVVDRLVKLLGWQERLARVAIEPGEVRHHPSRAQNAPRFAQCLDPIRHELQNKRGNDQVYRGIPHTQDWLRSTSRTRRGLRDQCPSRPGCGARGQAWPAQVRSRRSWLSATFRARPGEAFPCRHQPRGCAHGHPAAGRIARSRRRSRATGAQLSEGRAPNSARSRRRRGRSARRWRSSGAADHTLACRYVRRTASSNAPLLPSAA